jgi:hypothetical protein
MINIYHQKTLACDAAVYKLVDKPLRKGMYKAAQKGFYPNNQQKKQAFGILMRYNLVI